MGVRFGTPLYSGASWSGWGSHLLDRVVSGVWSDQEKLLHINLLELKALFLALQSFQELVAGRHVTAMCDNSVVVAYVKKQGGTVSHSLCSLASQLLRWAESLDVHLDARYLPGQSNVLADLLSRRDQVIGTEWSLHPRVARDLLRRWGSLSIDLFATSFHAKPSPILFPSPGSPGSLRGCVSPSLGQPGSLRVSALFSGRTGGGSSQRDPKSLHDSGRPPSGQRRSGSQTFSFY